MPKATVNSVYVLDSVPQGEQQTGYDLYYDVIKRYADFNQSKTPFIHLYLKLSSKIDFLEAINHIEGCTPYANEGVLIHLELHGSKDGVHFHDGSMLSWEEIKDKLIAINIALDNQLFITMASCYGRYLHRTIDVFKKAPFCAFISASKEIYPSEIQTYFEPFFDNLIKTRDMITSYTLLEQHGSVFYYKDVQVMFDELVALWMIKIESDKSYKESFKKQVEDDFRNPDFKIPNKDHEHLPDVNPEDLDFDEVLKQVKRDFIKNYRDNFLFGKGRNMSRPTSLLNNNINTPIFD